MRRNSGGNTYIKENKVALRDRISVTDGGIPRNVIRLSRMIAIGRLERSFDDSVDYYIWYDIRTSYICGETDLSIFAA